MSVRHARAQVNGKQMCNDRSDGAVDSGAMSDLRGIVNA